jgi:hypothetical protein
MSISAADAKLQQISVDKIDRNPDNPRIVFRPGELEDLLESIRVDADELEDQVRTQLRQLVARVEGFLRGEE